jgi:hypothetical protein
MEDETFFLRLPLCWGWATWNRAWKHFRKNNDVMLKFDRPMRRAFTFNNTYHFWRQLELNKKGIFNTWFVYWYAAVFLRNGLALYSGRSLVRHIGTDGSGVHLGPTTEFDTELANSPIHISPIPLKESEEAAKRHKNFFRKTLPPFPIRVVRRVIRGIGKLGRVIISDGATGK